jgi:hypothetical protein
MTSFVISLITKAAIAAFVMFANFNQRENAFT